MPMKAWRFAQRFQRCPPAVDDECVAADGTPASGGAGWRCSRNLPGAMLKCPGGLSSIIRCAKGVHCVQHLDAAGLFPAASMATAAVKQLMCPSPPKRNPSASRRRRRRRRRAPGVVTPTCCKTCVAGKACGDTCIAASLTCSTKQGCACDADSA
jgi:hypothetical protein